MSNETNYRSKYEQLKSQFMSSVDTAFRLGYQQGANDAQLEQAQTQQQQAQEAQSAQANAPGQPEKTSEQAPQQEEELADSENPAGSELDQHIAKLESMLGKSELTGEDMQKALKEVKSFKEKLAIKKNDKAIKAIAKALNKPSISINKQAEHNLSQVAKGALSMQEKIVADVMKSWEAQEQKAPKDIFEILASEGLTKKEE